MRATTFAFLLSVSLAASAAAEQRWYVFSIADTPVGHVSEDVEGGQTHTVVFARLVRLGKGIDMRFETTVTESPTGAFEALTYEAVLSQQPMRVEARVLGDRIRIATPTHENYAERFVERGSETPLGPVAVARRTGERLRAAGDSIDFAVFSPELQKVVRVRRKVLAAAEPVACNGARGNRLEEVIEGLPAARTLWVDGDGVMLADATPGPFGTMTSCRATREAALAAHGELPADLYERTVARSNVRFADATAIDRLVLRVRLRDASETLPDLTAANQRLVTPATVEVTRPRRVPGRDGATEAERGPNALVQSDDPGVVAVAQGVVGADTYAVAQALTRWVAENLSLDAGIVMAPASELVRDRKATCVGYATLLAALARAKGIPSRVVMGYVYYGGIWGGHAWTELLVDGSWLPFDAAVYAPGVASAARLAAGRSDLADGGGSLFPALAALFGRVEIDVLEYEQAGRTTRVGAGSSPYRVADGSYDNPGLGLRVSAAGWTVERAESTWPSPLVVAFRRGETVVELRQLPRFPEAPEASQGEATVVEIEGGTRWVWSASGPDAVRGLREILAGVERRSGGASPPAGQRSERRWR